MRTAQQPRASTQPRSSSSRSEDPRHVLGRLGEDIAATHFGHLGFAVLARNVRTRHGEIDLIAFDGETLVFVEVKSARVNSRARSRTQVEHNPLERLRPRQRAHLRWLATAWLSERSADRPTAREIRFDAVGVTLDAHDRLLRLDHLEAAW